MLLMTKAIMTTVTIVGRDVFSNMSQRSSMAPLVLLAATFQVPVRVSRAQWRPFASVSRCQTFRASSGDRWDFGTGIEVAEIADISSTASSGSPSGKNSVLCSWMYILIAASSATLYTRWPSMAPFSIIANPNYQTHKVSCDTDTSIHSHLMKLRPVHSTMLDTKTLVEDGPAHIKHVLVLTTKALPLGTPGVFVVVRVE